MKDVKLVVKNMVCESCEKIIEKSLAKDEGISEVHASYSEGIVDAKFNPEKTSVEQIIKEISDAGYSASHIIENSQDSAGESRKGINPEYIAIGIIAVALLLVAYFAATAVFGGLNISIPQLDAQTSVILIFIVGLLTGFHCIGMCGGFVLGYTAKARKENSKSLNIMLHSKYALGKILSYTVIGGIFGLIGSIFVFTPELRAGIAIFAGIFLIIYALKLLNIFPVLRKFSLPQGIFDRFKIGPLKNSGNANNNSDPLVIGLLNGLFIACGPLQAMYVLAATTGNFVTGGLMLLAFALGTLIPMLFFGVFASFLSHGFQNNIVRVSAVIVLVMGLLMINNGLALTGNAINFPTLSAGGNTATVQQQFQPTNGTAVDSPKFQIIRMDVLSSGWSPNSFVLKTGVPVKWIINGKELNGCNSGINVPAYNLKFNIKPGEQTIEFTPTQAGVIQWSCWMGMIRGSFIVRDDVGVDSAGTVLLSAQTSAAAQAQAASAPKPTGGCGCGGGSSCHT